MCFVTATELKKNLSYYMEKAKIEDVYVTKNKQIVCALVNPQLNALIALRKTIESLNIPESAKNKSYKELIGEAIEEKCDY